MKAVILGSVLALTALACTMPTHSAHAARVCPGSPFWCYPDGMGSAICNQYFCPDTPEYDPHGIYGSWVLRPEGQPFSNPAGSIWFDVWGNMFIVRSNQGWSASGNFDGRSGRYNWSYINGYGGVTTFWIDQNRTMHLQAVSLAGGGPWNWMASRR